MKTFIFIVVVTGWLIVPELLWSQNQANVSRNTNKETVVNPTDLQKGGNFTDENKNGICDRFENGKSLGKGSNFVDADKNGICDHRRNGNKESGKGFGQQNRNGNKNGKGYGRGYCNGKGPGKS
jgi:hypothetical protein